MSAVPSYRRVHPVLGHRVFPSVQADEMWPIDDHPYSSPSSSSTTAPNLLPTPSPSRFDPHPTLSRSSDHSHLVAAVPKHINVDMHPSSLDHRFYYHSPSHYTPSAGDYQSTGNYQSIGKCQTLTHAAISHLYSQQKLQQPGRKHIHPLSSSSCSPSASPCLSLQSQRHNCMPARHTMHPPAFRYAASATSVNSAPHIVTPTPSVSRNGSFYTDPPKVTPFSSLLPLRRFRNSSSARSRRRARRRSRSPVDHDDRSHRPYNQDNSRGINQFALSNPGFVKSQANQMPNSGGNGDGILKFTGNRVGGIQVTPTSINRMSTEEDANSGLGLRAVWGGGIRQRRQVQENEEVRVEEEGGNIHSNEYPCRASRQLEMDDIAHPVTLQGYCRMTWFARFRCTRHLRLIHTSLHCYDAAIRTRLWVVELHGARVRIHMPHKIVLSKLQCGIPIEFYVYDEQSCKHWAAALLHASSISSCTSAFAATTNKKKINKSPTDSSHLTATSTMSCQTRTTPSSSSTTSHSHSPSPSKLFYRARPVHRPVYNDTDYYSSYGGKV